MIEIKHKTTGAVLRVVESDSLRDAACGGPMTGADLYAARATLGQLWGKGRPLHASELGRALRLTGRDPGASIRDYEREKTKISGPMSVAIEMMLNGAKPPSPLHEQQNQA